MESGHHDRKTTVNDLLLDLFICLWALSYVMSTCRELQLKAYLSIHQSSVPSHLAVYHRSVEEAETEREKHI